MWAKLGQLFITYLLLPLAEKGIAALMAWFKSQKKAEEYTKRAKEKVEAYKNAKTKKESDDSFSDLP